MTDAGSLERFVVAQAGVHDRALREVRAGRKESHWMWFVYPQLRGLGRSEVSRFFGIASLDEAKAYLAHPILGPRLREAATAALAAQPELSAEDVFGSIDAKKLRSSMTLFDRAAADEQVFQRVLDRFFEGRPDEATLALLG
jgi:uncharacterized protein (DUF1810 family)